MQLVSSVQRCKSESQLKKSGIHETKEIAMEKRKEAKE